MKKIFLLLLVLTASPVLVLAQATRYTSVIAKDATFNINNNFPCPVANINLWYSIAAVKINSSTTAFCLIDHSQFTNTPLPVIPVITPSVTTYAAVLTLGSTITDFTINDLTIASNYAFFCGTYNGTQSFYGYFDINDYGLPWGGGAISGSNLNVYIFALTPSSSTTAPATLNKLVAYKETLTYKIVAIGSEGLAAFHSKNKIVEIFDATGTPSCKVADMPVFTVSGHLRNLYLNDIVLTANYVSVTGIDYGVISVCNAIPYAYYPWISVGIRGNVVDEISDPSINPNYYLPTPWEANDIVLGEPLTNDNIAIAYLYPVGTPVASTRLRVIDIQNMTNVNSQQLGIGDKLSPIDMIFMGNIGKLEILQQIVNNSYFIQLDPFSTTGYTTTALIPNNDIFKSITTIGLAYGNFISTRNAEVYIQDRTAFLPHSTATCPSDCPMDVKIIDNLPLKQTMCDIIQGTNNVVPLLSSPFTCNISSSIPLNTLCFSYE